MATLSLLGVLEAIKPWCYRCDERNPFIFARIRRLLLGVAGDAMLVGFAVTMHSASSLLEVFVKGVGLACGCICIGAGLRGLVAIRSIQIADEAMARASAFRKL